MPRQIFDNNRYRFVTNAPRLLYDDSTAILLPPSEDTIALPNYPSELPINMKPAFRLVLSIGITCTTLLSASAFDINTDLFVEGDLHAAWKADPLADPEKMFDKVPTASQKGSRRLARAGKVKGGVTAFVYEDAGDAANAYDIILEGMGDNTEVVENLGEQARSYSLVTKYPPAIKRPDFHHGSLVFLRGNTVIQIGLSDMKAEELIPYARKLDSRIQK